MNVECRLDMPWKRFRAWNSAIAKFKGNELLKGGKRVCQDAQANGNEMEQSPRDSLMGKIGSA
jgi:hypothetical protein